MKYEKNDVIKFSMNEYLILEVIEGKNCVYLYLINNDQYENDLAIVKVVDQRFINIENDEEFKYVINKLFLKQKNELLDIASFE